MVAIGVLCALFGGVSRYVDQHFYDAETFMENNADLGANADIRERLFSGIRQEIIDIAEGEPEEELATGGIPDLSPEEDINDPVTQQRIERDQAIEAVLLDVFDSPAYEQVFTTAMERVQLQVVRSAELESSALLRDSGDIVLNMRPLFRPIWEQLAQNPSTAEITQNAVPDTAGAYKVADRETTIDVVWTLMNKAPDWRGLFTAGAILAFIGQAVLSERRLSTTIQFGGGLLGVSAVVIVIVFLIRFMVPVLTGSGTGAVVAAYVSNTMPLVRTMIRLAIFGAVVAMVAGIARMIWPDDWVYSSTSDGSGSRSIMRRRGAPEAAPAPQQQQPVPAGYPGYGQQPYPAYPQQWGQPYPGQYPPGYAATYPVGPYAQPAQPLPQSGQPQHYAGPGKPTVPVMPVNVETDATGQPIAPAAPPADLPADAAQAVPRVVATTNATVIETASEVTEAEPDSSQSLLDEAKDITDPDEWASEKDW